MVDAAVVCLLCARHGECDEHPLPVLPDRTLYVKMVKRSARVTCGSEGCRHAARVTCTIVPDGVGVDYTPVQLSVCAEHWGVLKAHLADEEGAA